MNPKCHVLIPDGNSTWALTVMHCLSQNPDYKFFVLSDKKRTASKFSKYTSYYKCYNNTSDKKWLELITEEIHEHNISVIVPIAEDEISFFINNQKYLPNSVKVIPLPEIENFETAINKHKLSCFLNEHNLPHPKYKYFDDSKSFAAEELNMEFPIIIKPLHEKGGDGIVKFNDRNELDKYVKKYSDLGALFFQEYIDGYDIDCSVLCLNGKIQTHTIQKGKLEGDNSFAPQLSFDFITNDSVLNIVSHLMEALHWSGVAHIDLRYDQTLNTYKIIEINARFWGSVEGSKFAGVNFPDLAIQMAINNQIDKPEYQEIEYMRLKGVLKTISRNPLFIFKRKYLINNTETKSFLKDPIPTFYRFREWLERRF